MLKKRWVAVTLLVLVVMLCVVIGLLNVTTRTALLAPFFALAAFLNSHDAAVTAFGTVVIAAFTATIWLINRRQLKHARDVDRAYVSGGGPGNPPTGPFVLCINNYGRIAYGRFWYEDVWRRPHYASFILALPPRELPANVNPAFTGWT